MARLYKIKNWDANFENNRSRERDRCSFVCIPNKFGLGLNCLLSMPNGRAYFGIFVLMIEFCSRQKRPRNGFLSDDGLPTGCPLSARRAALHWHCTETEVQETLNACCSQDVGFIDFTEIVTTQCPPGDDAVTTQCPPGALEGKEGKEGKGMEEKEPPNPQRGNVDNLIEFPEILKTDEFKQAWTRWVKHRAEIKKKITPSQAEGQIRKLQKIGHDRAIACIDHTITQGWMGLREENGSGTSHIDPDDIDAQARAAGIIE